MIKIGDIWIIIQYYVIVIVIRLESPPFKGMVITYTVSKKTGPLLLI